MTPPGAPAFPADALRDVAGDVDWSRTALGAPEGWPPLLRLAADLVLDARTPRFIAWGPELCMLYNAPYVDILGGKHPAALGRPLAQVWPEIWATIAPLVARTMAGESLHFENRPFTIRRGGTDEQAWFSFSYTPIRNASGVPDGFYCALEETTAQVLAERERADSMQRLRQLFEQAPGFMAVVRGPDHVFELANAAYLRLVGREDVLGRPAREVVPETEQQGYFALLDEVYRTARPFVGRRMPIELRRADGSGLDLHYVDFVFQPIVEDDGRVGGIFVQGADVTDHELAQAGLRNREAQAREAAAAAEQERRRIDALLEAVPVGIGYADASGRLVRVNAANRALWGEHPPSRDPAEFVEWKGWWADGGPRHGEPLRVEDWGMMRALGGETVAGDVIDIEPFGAPGTRRRVLLRATPVRDADGAVAGAVVAQMDISDRVQAEAELRASEARFRTIADAMPQMVWSTLPDGFHDYFNERWYDFTGLPRGATDGDGWNRVFHPDDQARAWAAWQRSLRTGEPYEIEYRLRHRSGEYRWVLGRALPVRDADGRILRWMGTCTDIHEHVLQQDALQRSEEALRQSDRRKDEFLAMLAHELRNPLAPISTAAELLRVAVGDRERVLRASEIISRQVRHMTELVDDLLDVSRVTRGLVQLERAPVEMRGVLQAAVEQVRPLVDARGHALHCDLPDAPVHVEGDRTRLVQVVANLLGNAAKYTPPGGRIELVLRADAADVEVRVTDTGIGIDPALLPHVFDLFTQATRTPDRAQGGLGIGLALVRSLVHLHGGRVAAASAGPGCGSTFRLVLPRQAVAGGTVGDDRPEDVAAARGGRSITLVDDNADAAQTLCALLEALGHRVRVHHDAAHALAAAERAPSEVYVLDIGLPDLPGDELARRLRALPATAGARLIALTGYGQPQDRARSLAAGFDEHLVKPVKTGDLLAALGGDGATGSARDLRRMRS